MPRIFDGPIPERPERNALPGRIADLLDRLGVNVRPGDGERPGPWFDQLGAIRDDLFARAHGDQQLGHGGVDSQGQAPDGGPTVQTWHDLNPDAVDAKATSATVTDPASSLNFHADGEFTVRGEHYLSQALTAHADWFLP